MSALELSSASDIIQTLLAVGGAIGAVFAWWTRRKYVQLERQKIQLETEKAALEVQAERAAEADRAATQKRQKDLAYANAWTLKAEVDHSAGLAVRWIGNEIAIETLREAEAPLDTWQANKGLFAEVLSPEDWRRLVTAVEHFKAQSVRFFAVVNRHDSFTVDERKQLLVDLREAGEQLIVERAVVETALQPLFDLSGDIPGSGESPSNTP